VPPKVKALIVRVELLAEMVSVLRARDSRVAEMEALPVMKVLVELGARVKSPVEVVIELPERDILPTPSWVKPVIFFELPVISPPKVKALMVRVPSLEIVVAFKVGTSKLTEEEAPVS
jgi:hypothetical protein